MLYCTIQISCSQLEFLLIYIIIQIYLTGIILNDNENLSNDFSSLTTSTMTESTLIAMEATKIASTFRMEANMSNSVTSIQSDLEDVNPPSLVNSLANSTTDLDLIKDISKRSPLLRRRKKSLPGSIMVRRALNNSLQAANSLEYLENGISNLENMNPPSAMGDILDIVDMEGLILIILC